MHEWTTTSPPININIPVCLDHPTQCTANIHLDSTIGDPFLWCKESSKQFKNDKHPCSYNIESLMRQQKLWGNKGSTEEIWIDNWKPRVHQTYIYLSVLMVMSMQKAKCCLKKKQRGYKYMIRIFVITCHGDYTRVCPAISVVISTVVIFNQWIKY